MLSSMQLAFALVAALVSGCSSATADPEFVPSDASSQDDSSEAGLPDSSTGPDSQPSVDSSSDALNEQAQPQPSSLLAEKLKISEVSVFQSVKISLAKDGGEISVRNAPVVANRLAIFRVYVEPEAGYSPKPITGQLVIERKTERLMVESTISPSGLSTDAQPQSVFQFEVPAEWITEGGKFSVRLIDKTASSVADGQKHAARYPLDGTSSELRAFSDAGGIKLVLVPVKWNADGSGRLPDTSQVQIDAIRALLRAEYPLVSVDVAVHAPLEWNDPLKLSGSVDFYALNGALSDLKDADKVPEETYYFGLVKPKDSFNSYCYYSCVTGQSWQVPDPANGTPRVGAGVAFSAIEAASTLAHELGHLHGRYHAPCSTSNADSKFPYKGGLIGVWGMDPRDKTFLDPKLTTDFMGYCDDQWVSDYTYSALLTRIRTVNKASTPYYLGFSKQHQLLRINPDGTHSWGIRRRISSAAAQEKIRIRALNGQGQVLLETAVPILRQSHDESLSIALPEMALTARRIEFVDTYFALAGIDL